MIVHLTQSQIEADPYRLWNDFVGIIADEASVADPIQEPAHLVFVYESEVQNGGHLQFFENGHGTHVQQTIASLHHLGAHCQAKILEDAGGLWVTEDRGPELSREEFVERALERDSLKLTKDLEDARRICWKCWGTISIDFVTHLFTSLIHELSN